MRDVLIVTSLFCEASPLIAALGLKPVTDNELCARFQTFHAHGTYLAISGIGKMRSAVATSALLAYLQRAETHMIVANIGIAGGNRDYSPKGTLVVVNKVRDIATNTRYYPDIIIKHSAQEMPLETYDAPVTTPPTSPALVDMEGSGFMQAATTINPPSVVTVLKVVSDYCDGGRITPGEVSELISQHTDTITTMLECLRAELSSTEHLSHDEVMLLERVITHASLSASQRNELRRYARAAAAQRRALIPTLEQVLSSPISNKDERRAAYQHLLLQLAGESLL